MSSHHLQRDTMSSQTIVKDKETSHLIGNLLSLSTNLYKGDTIMSEINSSEETLNSRSISAPPVSTINPSNINVNPSNVNSFILNGEVVSSEDPRFSPSYYSYYYSQRPLDPRLPPPLFNWTAWHAANQQRAGISNTAHEGTSSSSAAGTSSSSKLRTPVDMIQLDFPRTPSPIFAQQVLTAVNQINQGAQMGQMLNIPSDVESKLNELSMKDSKTNPSSEPPVNSTIPMVPNMGPPVNTNISNISPMMAVMGYGSQNSKSFPQMINLASSPLIISPQEYQSFVTNPSSDFAASQVLSDSRTHDLLLQRHNYWDNSLSSNPISFNNKSLNRSVNVNNLFPQPSHVSSNPNPATVATGMQSSGSVSNSRHFSVDPNTHTSTIHGTARALLDEFRMNKGISKVTLAEVVKQALVVELAIDQHGSRFIQQRLEVANPEEKQMVFEQLLPDTLKLCTDVFEYGLPEHKNQIAEKIENHVFSLALQMYGCRVIQKALEVIDESRQAKLIRELEGHVMPLVLDQKCIERVPASHIQFIVNDFKNQVQSLASHPYGCRVIQRLLEHCSSEQKAPILEEILSGTLELVQDQYGNYVIQHVLERGSQEQRSAIIMRLHGSLLLLSKHKFASNVIEKCFQYGTDNERNVLIDEAIGKGIDGVAPIANMVKDQYANYVVQKVIDVVQGAQRARFIEGLKNKVPNLRKMTYGKHIIGLYETTYRIHDL